MIGAGDLPDHLLCERLREREKEISRLQLEQVQDLALLDRRRSFQSEGTFLSSLQWLRSALGMTRQRAAELLKMARRLEVMPRATAAVAAGRISFDHLRMVNFTAARLPEDLRQEADKALTPHATKLDPSRLALAGRFLRAQLDQEGALAEYERQNESRYFELAQTIGGAWHLEGLLDPEGGATLKSALDAVLKPPARDEERAHWQRSADALVELGRRALDSGGLPSKGGQKPHLAVVIGAEALKGAQAGALDWAGPVPGETIRRLACDCSASLLVAGENGKVIFSSEEKRVIPPSLRRALQRRDSHCRMPACDRPVAWTDGHHLVHWADGGKTILGNLACLCRRHHRMVHEGRWRLSWAPDGELIAEPAWINTG